MNWHWDRNKAIANRAKHGVSFELAQYVFDDPLCLTQPDDHPDGDRWQTIGRVDKGTLLVVHTIYEDDNGGRIISARLATNFERRAYEEGN